MFRPLKSLNLNAVCIAMTVASLALLAGCSANEEHAKDPVSTAAPATTSSKLAPLTEQDIAGNPPKGELICAFSVGRSTLLYAAGNVATLDDSMAIVKFASEVLEVRAPGGFDAMLRGTSFRGEKLVVEVQLAEHVEQPEKAGADAASSYPPATITYLRGNSPKRSVEGRWECGP